MNWYMFRFYVENLIFAAGFAWLAWFTYQNCGEKVTVLEKFTRNRNVGIAVALPALMLCVPHAELVSPAFLLPLLWPIAVVFPVLCYKYIDFYAARAIAGALIIYAYDIIHFAYEMKLPGAVVLTVAAWLAGIVGIWYSGKPTALRDTWRRTAQSVAVRRVVCGVMAVPAVMALWSIAAALFR